MVYRNTVGDERVVLADGWRDVDTDGVVVSALAGRELMGGGIAALADNERK